AMTAGQWALSDDLGRPVIGAAALLAVCALALLAFGLWSRPRRAVLVASTGLAGVARLLPAVTPAVRAAVRGTVVGPKVVVLLDQSRRLLIHAGSGTRRQRALDALKAIGTRFSDARVSTFEFGAGPAVPHEASQATPERYTVDSDLVTA